MYIVLPYRYAYFDFGVCISPTYWTLPISRRVMLLKLHDFHFYRVNTIH